MRNPWQALRGREQLHVVFWEYCVVGTIIVFALPAVDRPYILMGMPLWFFLVLALLQLAYLLWAHIALWRCAFNTSRRVWATLHVHTFAFLFWLEARCSLSRAFSRV